VFTNAAVTGDSDVVVHGRTAEVVIGGGGKAADAVVQQLLSFYRQQTADDGAAIRDRGKAPNVNVEWLAFLVSRSRTTRPSATAASSSRGFGQGAVGDGPVLRDLGEASHVDAERVLLGAAVGNDASGVGESGGPFEAYEVLLFFLFVVRPVDDDAAVAKEGQAVGTCVDLFVCGAAVDNGAAVVNRAKVVEVHAERDVLGVDPRLVGDGVAVAQGGEVVEAHLDEALGFSSALVDDAAVVNGAEDVEAHAQRQESGVDL